MKNKFRLQPYESRNIAEKILDGIGRGRTIREISYELTHISSSTIYHITKKLEDAGFIVKV
ncbi:MAG: hypothetical protein WAL88_00430 [Nitrosotalea sp.]